MPAIYFLVLLGVLVFGTLVWGLVTWRQHARWHGAASARGWRFTQHGWRSLFRSRFVIAGTTPAGTIWELRRVQRGRQHMYQWASGKGAIPYGALILLPANRQGLPHQRMGIGMRVAPVTHLEWPAAYRVLATHEQLVQWYLRPALAQALDGWPEWPAPGALEEAAWLREGTRVSGRYHADWSAIDRIVSLGIAMVEGT